MAKCGYAATTEAAVALVAATAKSVIGVNGTAAFGVDLQGVTLAFDGTPAGNGAALVEVCYATFATNHPVTASTSLTVKQLYGRALTAGFVAARNWTTEPTVLTVLEEFNIDVYKSTYSQPYSLGVTYDSAVSNGFVLRVTAPQVVNVRAGLRFERT